MNIKKNTHSQPPNLSLHPVTSRPCTAQEGRKNWRLTSMCSSFVAGISVCPKTPLDTSNFHENLIELSRTGAATRQGTTHLMDQPLFDHNRQSAVHKRRQHTLDLNPELQSRCPTPEEALACLKQQSLWATHWLLLDPCYRHPVQKLVLSARRVTQAADVPDDRSDMELAAALLQAAGLWGMPQPMGVRAHLQFFWKFLQAFWRLTMRSSMIEAQYRAQLSRADSSWPAPVVCSKQSLELPTSTVSPSVEPSVDAPPKRAWAANRVLAHRYMGRARYWH